MVEAGHDIAIFFYNPNIHPKREYEIRKEENKRYAADLAIPFVDADYDTEEWYRRARGMEFDPERGGRCSMCFDMRMERTALHAYENGFDCFTTTNATSRWKDQQQACATMCICVRSHASTHLWSSWRRMLTCACTYAGQPLGAQGGGAVRLQPLLLGVRLADGRNDQAQV